jgi:hypothetical protein
MFNNEQFRALIIKPSLIEIGLYSEDAEEILIATLAHESKGGTYLAQVKGPALGPFEMERPTFNYVWTDVSRTNPTIIDTILKSVGRDTSDFPSIMVYNLKFATQMARLRYFVVPKKIPSKDDLDGMWEMYKTYYNSSKGDATKLEFVNDYYHFIGKGISK